PVHFELPEDVAAQSIEDIASVSVTDISLATASSDAINQAAKRIASSQQPLVMIGGGANRPGLSPVLSDAIGALGIPFFNTQMGKGAVDGHSSLFIGTAALSSGDLIHRIIDKSDLIITVGHDTIEKPPFFMDGNGTTVIHVNLKPADIDTVYSPQYEVIGEIGDALTRIAEKLKDKSFDNSRILAMRDEMHSRISQGADSDAFPVIPQRLVSTIRKALPDDGILCLDNGMYKIWFARNFRTHIANTLLLDNALASMGAGLPSAMMAAMLYPSRRVICVCGDGGFMMNVQDLETAVRLGLKLTIVIVEDGAYGMIRWKQESDGFADFGMTFGNPDFVDLAKSFGAEGKRIGSADAFQQALAQADQDGGVQIIVVPIDYSENRTVLGDTPLQS
ncbi:MAG TPA: thiamine pyrophosphate-dependent enzyme, partial [Hyphomicrobiales bacterium]|nr:thiamine pyrophosphate-dependent enzyme [Hyphomicrobiales bacterium]